MKANTRPIATILATFLFLCALAAAQAQFTFTTNNGAITIKKYTGPGGDVTIPSTTNGLPVTGIGADAFQNCNTLTNVTVPDTVLNIGLSAFNNCSSLTNVALGSNVTIIANFTFMGCSHLTGVTIPGSVTNIGTEAFLNCTRLTGIYFEGNAPSADSTVFQNDRIATVYYLPGTCCWYTPFGGAPAVLWSPQAEFIFTTNNGAIAITGYIGPPGSVVTIPSMTNGLPVTSIGSCAFSNCTLLASVTIPDSVTNIGTGAFFGCTKLASVMTGNGVTSLEYRTFMNCYSLTNVTFGNNVTGIEANAFCACGFKSLIIPNGVTTIADAAFALCTSLTTATIPASVTSIPSAPFSGCSSLTAIAVDTNNPAYCSVDGVLFSKDESTLVQYPVGKTGTSYTISSGVTSIGSSAFMSASLSSVTIPESVTSIGYEAFSGCSSLASITIPSSVTNIGGDAFLACYVLTGAYFEGNAPSPSNDSSVFYGDNYATVYYMPGTLGWGTTFDGRPTAPWPLPYPVVLNQSPGFGLQTNGFGFTIAWNTNIPVVVEACTNLVNPIWCPLGTNTLTNGLSYFCDPQCTNNPACFYRVRSP